MSAGGAKIAGERTPIIEKDEEETWGRTVKTVVMAGAGFLADAYDLFVIDMVLAILIQLHPNEMGPWDKSLVASATLSGAVCGQLFFGILGDWLGRKVTFITTCFLIMFGALASACCVWTESGLSLTYQLAICRFLLGIGVGGEYPLAATITSENSSRENRGRMIAAVFSMQGWGMLLSTLFVLLFLFAGMGLEYIWRIVLALGAVPSAVVIYLRTQMKESEIFRKAHAEELDSAGQGAESLSRHVRHSWRIIKLFWHPLIGTTMSWLIVNITFYGTGSFKSRIGGVLLPAEADVGPRERVFEEALFAMYMAFMAIPGYLLSICFIDQIGRRRLQLGGFLMMALLFALVAYLNERLPRSYDWLIVVLFGGTFLFSNFGPNTTTFIIPVEVYPTLVRATCHGISAAAGKTGAVIGAAAFSPMDDTFGIETVLFCCSLVCLSGALMTYVFTSDEVLDLEDLDARAVNVDGRRA